nr:hypothetical protein [Campylobacter sp.]
MNKNVLLDTNIIIHREFTKPSSNMSVGNLYYWLDKLQYKKLIHLVSRKELEKYEKDGEKEILNIKLRAYDILTQHIELDMEFLDTIKCLNSNNENDKIDNILLYQVYKGYVDILITEDKGIIKKAKLLNLTDQVLTINQFVIDATNEYPDLIDYKALKVEKIRFEKINIEDDFFDSLRNDYEFDKWFKKKSYEDGYICYSDKNKIQGFLYLKIEDKDENYSHIEPKMLPKKRLKIGTFKVVSTGFRLGERFLKIVFDNAILSNVEEIYLTIFDRSSEQKALMEFLEKWGFELFGKNINTEEKVMIKKLGSYDSSLRPRKNFPNIRYFANKMFLPIESKWHTKLFPDSILKNEKIEDFMSDEANLYALQKVYISFARQNIENINKGDLILIYRKGEDGTNKKFTSVVTSLCILDDYRANFSNMEEYLQYCKNRTVFSKKELIDFWNQRRSQLVVIKLIFVKEFKKKVILEELWKTNIIEQGKGPRPFTKIGNEHYNLILEKAQTQIKYMDKK